MIAIVVALALAAPEPVIQAEGKIEIACSDENPKLCSVALEQGDFAPFTGQLLTPELALALGQAAEACDERLRIDLDAQARALVAQYEQALEDERPSFFERPIVVAILTSATFGLALWSVGQVR